MDELTTLERTIGDRLSAAQARRQESQQILASAMAERKRKIEQCDGDDASRRLMESLIRPYVLKLVSVFPNAHIQPDVVSTEHHCACRFDHTSEYPVPFAGQYQRENVVVDPVCGMSINRAGAGATWEHNDRTYCFCVEECCNKFEQDPARYVARQA